MRLRNRLLLFILAISAIPWLMGTAFCQDEEPAKDAENKLLPVEVLVTDHNGEPVKDAKVKPWAIQSSQGHGMWHTPSNGFEVPEARLTDSSGKVTVQYPYFNNVEEQVRSTGVSISIVHPDHAPLTDIHISVPRKRRYKVKLPASSAIEATVLIDGEPVMDDNIHAVWTGGSYMSKELTWTRNEDANHFRIPPIKRGNGQVMFVRLDGDKVTHFSNMDQFEIDGTEKVIAKEFDLVPAVTIRGKLSDNVSRPVVNGRIKAQTVGQGKSWDEVTWSDWAKVEEDGTFEISSWPQGEPIQIVALCDGFIGKSGDKPDMVSDARAQGGYWRPQFFADPSNAELTVEMETMSVCRLEVENAFGKMLEEVSAAANPNVGWWNSGSQIYCWPLTSSLQAMTTGKYHPDKDADDFFQQPFKGVSDENGIITIELPVGNNTLWVGSERFQLPAKLGRRTCKIKLERNKSSKLELVLQPKGLDVLGDWEDLCGLVFG